jgi:hypothetical protein
MRNEPACDILSIIAPTTAVITIVSAYLIVAYIAGRNLTRPQVILVNALLVSFSVYAITAMYGFSRVATELASLSIGMSTQRSEVGVTTVAGFELSLK